MSFALFCGANEQIFLERKTPKKTSESPSQIRGVRGVMMKEPLSHFCLLRFVLHLAPNRREREAL